MGLWSFLRRLFFPARPRAGDSPGRDAIRRARKGFYLRPLDHPVTRATWGGNNTVQVASPPYRFARRSHVNSSEFLDLSHDGDDARLNDFGLPRFHTPDELAAWLQLPVGRLAWLVHRFSEGSRPASERDAHYHYRWMRKRSRGWRLIESPKPLLKLVQTKILREILDLVPPHSAAHGFAAGRSIVTNARPHVGSRVLYKLDLENFYATVTFSRVTGIFRGMGYSREAAIWLARLTTSALPLNTPFVKEEPGAILPYLRRHLPQGAPTSPALANLSAWRLDVRLAGLARAFGARYTRYADDLTFSGPQGFVSSLKDFIPVASRVIHAERFHVNKRKSRVLRDNARQSVTGVVVNRRLNLARTEYDRLKAILHNCARHGAASQNRDGRADFAAHLRGRIAHAMQLHPDRGAKLLQMFSQIDWRA